jgi:hypothetical protein
MEEGGSSFVTNMESPDEEPAACSRSSAGPRGTWLAAGGEMA